MTRLASRRKPLASLLAALLTPALLAVASNVQAQSSVQLYGIIDAGLTYFSNLNGHGTFVANDGAIQANRWGLRGSEDLGDGRRAIFALENGFNLYSGTMVQSGVLFSRQAWLGLQDNALGTVTFGKQYDFFWDNLTQFTMGQLAGQYSWHPGDFDHLAGTLHINNAIKYTSPNWAGLTLGALYATPSSTVSAGTGRVIAFGAKYANDGLSLGAAYTNTHNSGVNAPTQAGTTIFPDLPPGPAVLDNIASWGVGGSYRYGPNTTRLLFTSTRFRNGNESVVMNTYEANQIYRWGPAWTFMGGYWYSKMGSQKWQNVTALADYALSKRTDVYAEATWLYAGGGAAPVFLGGGAAPTFVNGTYTGQGPSSTAVRIGMRHTF
ncbi:Outer membrane porin protein [Pandoraea pneumonica]|uniref:Outer membrane porin protein n=1 Tax=Pandoraea pneumonica TaxID=2508299 RepID=A0A5E4TYB5_9BURK|nr:porin [Pandoraea pneumonica]VVD92860.1 Outer membrane porin protein [Pandoraea pneumonica]